MDTSRADRRKYHYIYKITRADGRYYIGMHSTDNLIDGYFGSGQLLWHSINKHGIEKHSKEIIEHCFTREALREREKEIVNQELLDDPLCMNIVPGGGGGPDVGKLGSEGLKLKRQDPEFEKQYKAKMLEAGARFRERRLSDPDFQLKLVNANKKAAEARKIRRQNDLEYDKRIRENLSNGKLGRKDTEQSKANKKKAQQIVAKRDLLQKQESAAKARAAILLKTDEELLDMKRRQSEGAKNLVKKIMADPILHAEIMKKKRDTYLKNGSNIMSAETKEKISKANKGLKRSPEVIAKAKARKGEQTTCFGTVWMKNSEGRKRVKKEFASQYLEQGYVYGKV